MDFTDSIFNPPPNAAITSEPAGCGKTQAALEAIIDVRWTGSAFNTIRVVLATRSASTQRQSRPKSGKSRGRSYTTYTHVQGGW